MSIYYLTDEVLAVGSAYSYQNICDPISVTPFIRASWFGGHLPSHDATSVYERISHTALLKSNKNYPIIHQSKTGAKNLATFLSM